MATPLPTNNLHFVIFPYTASGHMLPMVDIARILAQRGAMVTLVTTPALVNRFKLTINRLKLNIRLLELPLTQQFGLPEGRENANDLTTGEIHKIYAAMELLEKPAQDLLQKLTTPPDCIISDLFYSWTTHLANQFNIPRIVFYGPSCFYLRCMDVLTKHKMFQQTDLSDTQRFVLPELPHRVGATKLMIGGRSPSSITTSSLVGFDFRRFIFRFMEAGRAAYGVVVNTFEELEPEYVKEFQKERCTNVYCIGPVSLCNKDRLDIAERGNIDDHYCLQWLDEKEVESVVYVCLGTVVPVSTKQLIELGLGLESTNKPFIWCVRNTTKELEKWFLEQGFEERVKDRGLIIHGYAPQVLILSHPSIGCFLTHCGWSSSLETICAGVPVVTWPFQYDQFFNEIYMVEILKIGVSLGVEEAVISQDIEDMKPLVKKEDVKTAVNRLLDEQVGIGKECRERVRKLAEMANKSMTQGGSSYLNVSKLFQDVSDFSSNKT